VDYGYWIRCEGLPSIIPREFPDRTSHRPVLNLAIHSGKSTRGIYVDMNKTVEFQIYTIAELAELAQTSVEPELEPPHQLLLLNMTYQIADQVYSYTTRDAAFSHDGSRIVTCTNHVYGSALIFILSKDHNNSWQILGRHCLVNRELDMMDDDCLGYTGVSL
jgi:hypothetical protein